MTSLEVIQLAAKLLFERPINKYSSSCHMSISSGICIIKSPYQHTIVISEDSFTFDYTSYKVEELSSVTCENLIKRMF